MRTSLVEAAPTQALAIRLSSRTETGTPAIAFLNGVSTNNLFNGNSTSQVGENRFVLNTGENFGAAVLSKPAHRCMARLARLFPPAAGCHSGDRRQLLQYDATQGNNSARTSAY